MINSMIKGRMINILLAGLSLMGEFCASSWSLVYWGGFYAVLIVSLPYILPIRSLPVLYLADI